MEFRAIDNNAIGAAVGYFRKPENPSLEPAAHAYFTRYVDTYINASHRLAFGPADTTGDLSTFFRLWQTGAKQHVRATSSAVLSAAVDTVWEQYLRSIAVYQREWISWLRYQWSPELTRDYRALLPNWRSDLRQTLEYTRSRTSRLNPVRDARLSRMVDALVDGSAEIHVPDEYEAERRDAHTEIVDYAIAYSFDMFSRGAWYRGQTAGVAVTFHALRDSAAAMTVADEGIIAAGQNEISWGAILDACLAEGIVRRDPELFADLLRGFRSTVQSGREFEERMAGVQAADNPEVRHQRFLDAVLSVFLEEKIAPVLRSNGLRANLIRLLGTLKDAPGLTGRAFGPFIYELGKIVIDSNFLRLVDVQRRRRFADQNLWKVYRLPGVD